jgi:hypothetical protein
LAHAAGIVALAASTLCWSQPIASQELLGAPTGNALAHAGDPRPASSSYTQKLMTGDAPGTSDHPSGTDKVGDNLRSFGFLVFDWDPAHGAIPGFGPLPIPRTDHAGR